MNVLNASGSRSFYVNIFETRPRVQHTLVAIESFQKPGKTILINMKMMAGSFIIFRGWVSLNGSRVVCTEFAKPPQRTSDELVMVINIIVGDTNMS